MSLKKEIVAGTKNIRDSLIEELVIININSFLEGNRKRQTEKFTFIVKGVGIGTAPMKISTHAETQAKAVKYIKARWKDCSYELI